MDRQRSACVKSQIMIHRGVRLLGAIAAIATPLATLSTATAQQALPPPPSIPGGMELPSLTPVAPPASSVPMAPLPGSSVYPPGAMPPASVTVPGLPAAPPTMLPPASVTPLEVPGMPSMGVPNLGTPTMGMPATGYPGMGMPGVGMPQMPVSYYQVVIPTRPELFSTTANKMLMMGVRPEAIQARHAPLGPHLAVGPFNNAREAESVSTYLRSGGMDARVFFQR